MDVTEIPLHDAKAFLRDNDDYLPSRANYVYKHVKDLIKSRIAKIIPVSIEDFIIADTLRDSDIPIYKSSYILTTTTTDADLWYLSRQLHLSSIDKERIIRILRYLHKLDNDISLFDLLPDEIWLIIFNVKSIFMMRQLSQRFYNLPKFDELAEILSAKLHLNLRNSSLVDIKYFCSSAYIMIMLNKLDALYDISYTYENIPPISNLDAFFEIELNKGLTQSQILENLAKLPVPYDVIIITSDYTTSTLGISQLTNFNTRTYITSCGPGEIKISASVKGSDITIDDILFASRFLFSSLPVIVRNATRYSIISDSNDTLVLKPDMSTAIRVNVNLFNDPLNNHYYVGDYVPNQKNPFDDDNLFYV